jgi:hypothetical protein
MSNTSLFKITYSVTATDLNALFWQSMLNPIRMIQILVIIFITTLGITSWISAFSNFLSFGYLEAYTPIDRNFFLYFLVMTFVCFGMIFFQYRKRYARLTKKSKVIELWYNKIVLSDVDQENKITIYKSDIQKITESKNFIFIKFSLGTPQNCSFAKRIFF